MVRHDRDDGIVAYIPAIVSYLRRLLLSRKLTVVSLAFVAWEQS